MVNEHQIRTLVEERLKGTNYFIVGISVKPSNKIEVLIDSISSVSINDCADLSRYLESSLNREEEDYELMVSSAGIESPFQVDAQYIKNIGRNVEITTTDGRKITGKLTGFQQQEVELEIEQRQNKVIGKGKETVKGKINLNLNQIKQAKIILSFK